MLSMYWVFERFFMSVRLLEMGFFFLMSWWGFTISPILGLVYEEKGLGFIGLPPFRLRYGLSTF